MEGYIDSHNANMDGEVNEIGGDHETDYFD